MIKKKKKKEKTKGNGEKDLRLLTASIIRVWMWETDEAASWPWLGTGREQSRKCTGNAEFYCDLIIPFLFLDITQKVFCIIKKKDIIWFIFT